MEYDEDGYIKNPPKGMVKGTEEDRKRAAKMGLKGPHLEGEGRVTKKQLPPLPVRKPKKSQAEEVEFTEEELAEAFAIFLDENFHVDMLTEEDLDFVFEEEFPQWLEEGGLSRILKYINKGAGAIKKNPKTAAGAAAAVGYNSTKDFTPLPFVNNKPPALKSPFPGEDAQIAKEKKHAMTGGLGDGNQIAKAPPVPSTARTQVSRSRPASTAKSAASARNRTGGPSLYQKSKRAVRSTPGDPGRTATDRLKYMAARGNRASQKALRGPKKNWRSSVFEPQN